jgi:hypothetical protein
MRPFPAALEMLSTKLKTLNKVQSMEKVTGIGGIFFRAKDPARMSAWYREQLGIDTKDGHADFVWREHERPDVSGPRPGPFSRQTPITSALRVRRS